MKMHILAAAFLTALAARGASASSEGGDTWSRLQPRKQGGPAQTAGLAAKPML